MPIPLGILAAAGFRPAGAAGAYELIETVTVGSGGAASVSFTGLSAYSTTYQHLQIRYTGRSSFSGSVFDQLGIRFNNDSAGNYSWHILFGSQTGAVESAAGTNTTGIEQNLIAGSIATTNAFGFGVIDILDPYEAKNKTTRNLNGQPNGTGGQQVRLTSGAWRNTNAVSSIQLYSVNGATLSQFSRFSIYGLKVS